MRYSALYAYLLARRIHDMGASRTQPESRDKLLRRNMDLLRSRIYQVDEAVIDCHQELDGMYPLLANDRTRAFDPRC